MSTHQGGAAARARRRSHSAWMTLTIDADAGRLAVVPSPIPLLPSAVVSHAEREIADGRLVRVRRGVLAPAAAWADLAPWNRYTARVHAVAMTHPDAVFCLESAAALLGAPIFGHPRDVHILDLPSANARLSGGVRCHTTRQDRLVVEAGGLFVTSVVDTAVDISRARHGALALAVADASLRRDPSASVEALVARNESRLSKRGRRMARWPLHRATPDAETALESLSRAVIEWLGFDEPALQKDFRTNGVLDRCDMWWEGARVIGEADGELKYDGSLQPPAEAIRKEKARDRRLLAHTDRVVHWGWAEVVQVDPLREILRRAGLRQRRPESSRELYALTALLGRRSSPTAP